MHRYQLFFGLESKEPSSQNSSSSTQKSGYRSHLHPKGLDQEQISHIASRYKQADQRERTEPYYKQKKGKKNVLENNAKMEKGK
jgi:SOS response regulatory protein OraA/RecX